VRRVGIAGLATLAAPSSRMAHAGNALMESERAALTQEGYGSTTLQDVARSP
jgi:hypothetical protein